MDTTATDDEQASSATPPLSRKSRIAIAPHASNSLSDAGESASEALAL
jgi:hypothetical protein